MNSFGFKYLGALVAAALCSACSGGSAVPSSASFAGGAAHVAAIANGMPTTAAITHFAASPRYQQIVPDSPAAAKAGKYEFVFNQYGTYAGIFNYPKTTREIGSINGLGGQGCTNVLYGYGKKIFWNVGGQDQITEFQVPSTPIKTLSVNYVFPSSCAMDTSGDLAVGILYGNSSGGGGEVVIFKNSTGSGTSIKTPLDEEFFDGYDTKGNLFADGFTGDRSGFALVEVPAGSSKAVTIKTSNSPVFPGSVQWDGKYVTVFDQLSDATYQYTISGTTATLEHTVTYKNYSMDCAQTWIVKNLMYCGDAGNDAAEVFKYPQGGSPVATFTGNFDVPLGVTAAKN